MGTTPEVLEIQVWCPSPFCMATAHEVSCQSYIAPKKPYSFHRGIIMKFSEGGAAQVVQANA